MIAAIDSFASPHRRHMKSSPSQRASNPNSAIAAGSSINSIRIKLLASKGSPVTDEADNSGRTCLVQISRGFRVHGIEKLGNLYDHLASLPNDEFLALQSRQMLSHPRARRPHQVRDVRVAERHAEQSPARFLDAKVGAQFQQRDRYALVQA